VNDAGWSQRSDAVLSLVLVPLAPALLTAGRRLKRGFLAVELGVMCRSQAGLGGT
jgi:hypothetical protein